MRELGINVEETAIMSAVTPVVAILMPPLAGMLADKIGNFKVSANSDASYYISVLLIHLCDVIVLGLHRKEIIMLPRT